MTSLQIPSPAIIVQGEEDPIEIGFDAVAAYHGQAALAMLATTFQAIRAALAVLSPDRPVRRSDLAVVSGHPGPGVRDAFEFATRAVTRGAYVVDRSLPAARLVPGFDISYSFRVSLGGTTAEVALRPDALPEEFFILNFKKNRSDAENREISRLKKAIAADVLSRSSDDLFSLNMI